MVAIHNRCHRVFYYVKYQSLKNCLKYKTIFNTEKKIAKVQPGLQII